MNRKTRNFGKQFKEYREEYLEIKQLEAAELLSITPSALSNYERMDRDVTSDMLADIKRTFDIPDDYFIAMLLGEPLHDVKSDRPKAESKTGEIHAQYRDQFIEHHRSLLEDHDELREIIAISAFMTEKDRRIYFNSIKSNLTVFRNLLMKYETSNPSLAPSKKK